MNILVEMGKTVCDIFHPRIFLPPKERDGGDYGRLKGLESLRAVQSSILRERRRHAALKAAALEAVALTAKEMEGNQ